MSALAQSSIESLAWQLADIVVERRAKAPLSPADELDLTGREADIIASFHALGAQPVYPPGFLDAPGG